MNDDQALRKAAQAVVDRWETPLWKDAPATGTFIYALRDALAAQPPEAIEQAAQRMASGKTGWTPGLMQDDCRGLSKALASKPDARRLAREAAEAINTEAAQREADAQDAARYRWLRTDASWRQATTILNDSPSGIDAAIDDAIQTTKPQAAQHAALNRANLDEKPIADNLLAASSTKPQGDA